MPREEAAYWMLQELKQQRLEVVKVNGLRVAVSRNPELYQDLCRIHSSRRRRHPKVRTYIKRCHVERTLRGIVAGTQNTNTVYAQRLESFLERYGR